MGVLALNGGKPVRTAAFPVWPRAGAEERAWLERVLEGQRWFAGALGDDPDALGTLFGRRFAEFVGVRHALPVANGSVSLEIALRALRIGPGDEVIVPAYTYVSTGTSVLMVGAVPVFADMERSSYCMDPKDAERKITPRTRALIPVHLGGQMADMERLTLIAQRRGLEIVEDAAQSIGAAGGGCSAGAWGALGSFSFQSNKTITSGEGGLLTTDDDALAERVTALRAVGRFATPGATVVRSSALLAQELSSNYRLAEWQSAVLLAQLARFPELDARRQANAARLTQLLGEVPGIEHVRCERKQGKHGYYYYLVRFDPQQFAGLTPERLCQALNAEGIPFVPGDDAPIYCQPVFRPDNLRASLPAETLNHYLAACNAAEPGCPVAEEACCCTLILRHQVLLGDSADMEQIAEALAKLRAHAGELAR